MKLKILGPNYRTPGDFSPENYRGLERPSPSYVSEVDEAHEVNKLFFQYLEIADDRQVINDLGFCQRLLATYKNLDPPQFFEIVEFATNNEAPTLLSTTFLGFDIACVYRISLLYYGLEIDGSPRDNTPENDLVWVMQPLFRLIKTYFKPKLNENGLFNEYDTAQFCLETMMALQKIRPNLWEGDDCKFEVIGLWKVDLNS